jgi:hypothetical protein
LPRAPVVHITGPGRVSVYRGDDYVAGLDEGRLRGSTMDVFASEWLAESFAPVRAELGEIHREARERARVGSDDASSWAPLDADLTRLVGQQMVRRIISIIRDSRHGGTVLAVPPELTDGFSGENRYVGLKYRFASEEPRQRFRSLIIGVMNRLAAIHGKGGEASYPTPVGWQEYRRTPDARIAELDEGIFEIAHLVAALGGRGGGDDQALRDRGFRRRDLGAAAACEKGPSCARPRGSADRGGIYRRRRHPPPLGLPPGSGPARGGWWWSARTAA